MYKIILLNKIKAYLEKTNWMHKNVGKVLMLNCHFCGNETNKLSAQQIPNTYEINCHHCSKKYTLIDVVQKLHPDIKDEEDVYQHIKESLNLNIETQKDAKALDKTLTYFEENNFDLVPIAKNAKIPIEQGWTQKTHINKVEWQQWLISGLNIGVKTGKCSEITIIDIDAMPTAIKEKIYKKQLAPDEIKKAYQDRDEKLKKVLSVLGNPETNTLTQKSVGGLHLIFKYDHDLPKTAIQIEDAHIDIENDGGQVVIHPSRVSDTDRILDFKQITTIPETLKVLLLNKAGPVKKSTTEMIKEEIESENFQLNMFGEGERNSSLVKLGGVFRKELNAKQTEFVLHVLNNHNAHSLPYKEISAMAKKLEHYIIYDEQELAHNILEYLKITECASKAEIEIAVLGKRATGEEKQRIDKTLVYLVKEEKILKHGREYRLIRVMEWSDTIVDVGVPISEFEIPYLNDYNFFNWGDLIIVGSQNKYGKTTLAMNFVKRLVDQGIKPYYIYSESGGRFAKTAMKLGMQDGDFWRLFSSDPNNIKIEPNTVIIYDWVRPKDGFHKTDELYDNLTQKLEKTKSIMICFVQLKKNNEWFAPNMITQYPALACKYLYEAEADGTHTKFEITEVRDARTRGKQFIIPCEYNWDTKEVIRKDIPSGEEQ